MDLDRIQLEKRYEYQLSLISRRWQYLAAYIAISGFLVSSIFPKLLEAITEGAKLDPCLYWIYPLIGLINAIAFTNLVSLATVRIHQTQLDIGKDKLILQLKGKGKFLGKSETIIIYICIYSFSIVWVALAFYIFFWLGIGMLIILFLNLFLLNWRSGKKGKKYSKVRKTI